jgi:hypothetical protein
LRRRPSQHAGWRHSGWGKIDAAELTRIGYLYALRGQNRHCPDAWRFWHEAGIGPPDICFIQQAALGPTSLGHTRSRPNHTSTKWNSGTVCQSLSAAATAEGGLSAVT